MAGREGPYRRDNNSTSYVHPNEENLFNLHKAMEYNDAGQPVIRTSIGSDSVTITGNVTIPGIVTVTNTDDDPLFTHTHLYDENDVEYSAANPFTVDGTVSINQPVAVTDNGGSLTVDGAVGIIGNVNVTQGTDPWIVSDGGSSITVDGTVGLDAATLAALENITVTVDNEISINDGGNSITVDGNVGIVGNVNVTQGTDPWNVSGNVTVSAGNITATFNGASKDAFGRLRISEPYTLFDTAQRYRDHQQFSSATSGTATVVYHANSSTFELNVGSTAGDSVIRETKKVFPYQPGKSLLIMMTGCMNTAKTNLRQRMGFFGAQNGVYFEQVDSTLNMVIRSYTSGSIVETRIAQSSWNGDRLDGSAGTNNPSGITLNPALSQIFFSDIEWLGVGTVRVGFVINGQFITCHSFHHANITGNTTTYMTTATLPLRYEITNTNNTASSSMFRQICATVISEGGYNNFGTTQTAGTGVVPLRLFVGGTYYPVVTIRLNSTRLDSIVFPRQIDILSPTVNYYRWTLLQNATLTGATFATTSTTGSVDIDVAATAVSGGIEIQSGLASSRELSQLSAIDFFQFQLGRTLAGVSDTVTLAIAAISNNADVLAEIGWQELT